jgi:hypothetical protein
MSAIKRIVSVRLPEVEVRKYKVVAASRGVSMQEAVHQALENWVANTTPVSVEPLDALQGSLADCDVMGLMRREKQAEFGKDSSHS